MKRKLGINSDCFYGIDDVSALEFISKAGFETFMTSRVDLESVSAIKKKADELGIEFSLIHSPFRGINNIWLEGEAYREVYDRIIESIDSAAACGVPAVVVHVSSGWNSPNVNDLGFSRFDAIVEHAASKGVILAFENLRMVGNLACLIDRYENNPYVRYCFDCGHEHCYTKTVSWLDIFTNKVVATHIHDNMGRPFDDKTTDRDAHLLPFDGTYNYHDMMQKFDRYGYEGPLMLEVFQFARSDYKAMTPEAFMVTCYERIKRISEINL